MYDRPGSLKIREKPLDHAPYAACETEGGQAEAPLDDSSLLAESQCLSVRWGRGAVAAPVRQASGEGEERVFDGGVLRSGRPQRKSWSDRACVPTVPVRAIDSTSDVFHVAPPWRRFASSSDASADEAMSIRAVSHANTRLDTDDRGGVGFNPPGWFPLFRT